MSDEKPVIAEKKAIVLDMELGTYNFCTCGRSQKQPFCDGAHAGTSFVPEVVEITEKKKYAWCACKHSGKGAMCDGRHKNL